MTRVPFPLLLAWRELRAAPGRWALVVAPIAAGVAALVSMQSFAANLNDSVRVEARSLLGADLALRSAQPLTPPAEDLLRATLPPGVETAEVVSFGAMAFVPGGSGARLVVVTGIDGAYPFHGTVTSQPPGHWPPPEDPVALVDPALPGLLGARVGGTLALGNARFRIAGTLDGYPGDVGIRSAFGPRVVIHARHLAGTGLLGFGSRARYERFLRLPEGADALVLANRLRGPLAGERVTLRTVDDDQQRLDRVLGRLVRFLSLVGMLALLLGGVGVASGSHVFVEQKLTTVAVLRCLGASVRQVLAAYVFQALVVGVGGGLLGAGLGLVVQRSLPALLAPFLPVVVEPRLSWSALALGIGVGAWVALAFALPPLLRLRHVPPLAALRAAFEPVAGGRDRARLVAVLALALSLLALASLQAGGLAAGLGFGAGIGVALLLLWLAAGVLGDLARRLGASRLPYLWRQGFANLYRPANQTRAVVLSLGFGGFVLGAVMLVQHNLLGELRVDGDGPNVVLFDIQPDQLQGLQEQLAGYAVAPTPPVPIVPMRLSSVKGRDVDTLLAGVDEGEDAHGSGRAWAFRREYRSSFRDTLLPAERSVRGQLWVPGAYREAPADAELPISIEADLAETLGVGLGDALVWDVQGVPVASRVAHVREVDFGRFEPNFFVLFPEGPLDLAPHTLVTLLRLDDAPARGRLQREVMERFPNVSVLDLSQIRASLDALVERAAFAVRFMALFSLAAGTLVLIGALSASRRQRLREAVLLKTLGATRRQLRRIAAAEYLALGSLAAIVGLLLASVAGGVLSRLVFEQPFALPWAPLAGLGLGIVALTLLIGLWNSVEAFRRTPLELLRAD